MPMTVLTISKLPQVCPSMSRHVNLGYGLQERRVTGHLDKL